MIRCGGQAPGRARSLARPLVFTDGVFDVLYVRTDLVSAAVLAAGGLAATPALHIRTWAH